MLSNNNSTNKYNNFEEMPYYPYKVVEVLLLDKSQDVEDFWKLLQYGDIDCLSKPNLTFEEKKKVVWQGDSIENEYSVFIKPMIGSSMDDAEAQTQLRLYRYNTVPDTSFTATICYEADFITNEKTSLVRKNGMLVERTDLMESIFLNFMNGRDIAIGSGFLTFDRGMSRTCKSQLDISNSKSFYGRSLIMALYYTNIDSGGVCG